jgi:hypothetical protein
MLAAALLAASMNVTAHFHVPNDRLPAKVYSRAGDTWKEECSMPCTVQLPSGARVRIVIEGHDDDAGEIVLEGEDGRDVDVVVSRGGRGGFVAGIVFLSVGGAAALIGAGLVAMKSIGHRSSDESSSTDTIGGIMFLSGAAVAGVGVVLLLNRSYEPRVRQGISDRPSAAAALAPFLPATMTPFSLTFAF